MNPTEITEPLTPDTVNTPGASPPINLDDLRELLLLVAALCNALTKAKEDGRITVSDLKYMLPVIKRLKPALDDIGDAWDALRDMSADQANRLSELFCLEVGVPVTGSTTVLMASALRVSADLSTIIRQIGELKSAPMATTL